MVANKRYEAAARKLCKIRGDDPDGAVRPRRGTNVVGEDPVVRRWEIEAAEIRKALELQEAIAATAEVIRG